MLHHVLGTGISAHVLSYIYIMFLTFVPVSLGAALVWSKNVATGFWYVTALCINWVLGALSYYWLPSLGPFYKNGAFNELPETGVTALQRGLAAGRQRVLEDPHSTTSIQSVAAFASLHVSIIFTAALICHYVIQSRWVRWTMWIYFVLTAISTVYFGWHYLLDDIAGSRDRLDRRLDRSQDDRAHDGRATTSGRRGRRGHRGVPARERSSTSTEQ